MNVEGGVVKEFDIIVIGAGGGTKLVKPVSRLKKRVAVIEREAIGGTCLNRGCIPSKMLIHPADVMQAIRQAKKYYINSNEPRIDFKRIVDEVSNTIDMESLSAEPMYANDEYITFYKENAVFISPKVLDVAGERITAPIIVFAPGADVFVPNFEGLEETPYMTYREALRLNELPDSITVVGGGYIATELAHMFGGCGSKVNVVVRSEMLKGEDREIRDEFERVFSAQYATHKGFVVSKVEYKNEEFRVHISNGIVTKTLTSSHLLIATGILPNTSDINIEKSGIQLDNNGFVTVDEHLQTSQQGTYAFGDVIGKNLFRHTANFEGEYLCRHLFHGEDKKVQYPAIPHAVFSSPQIGAVGATEEELLRDNKEYFVGKVAYKKSAMGMALKSDSGIVKLLFDASDSRLLGAHIVGEEASNMIHMCIAYIQCGATLQDLLATIYIHPALPELIRNAARDAHRKQVVSST